MNLWEKIKESVQESAVVVSKKASDLVETGTELVQEGLQKLTNDEVDALEVSKLQSEVDELRKTIQGQFTALGGELYVLYTSGQKEVAIQENTLTEFMTDQIEKLEKLREELEAKEQTLKELQEKYEAQSVSMNDLKKFKDELEAAGASLEHLVVDESSPYIGKTLSELDCPADVLLGLIIRGGTTIIPCGDDKVQTGDKIVVMGKKEDVVDMLHKFRPEVE
ncbi:MAG: TrkA C-terminal domain-containing protein [bacterium]